MQGVIKMKELKSAFEIEGFMSGETVITNEGTRHSYRVKGSSVYAIWVTGEEAPTLKHVNIFMAKEWYPVEQKKKYWRHEYILTNDLDNDYARSLVIYTTLEFYEYHNRNPHEEKTLIESKQVEL